MMKKLIAMILAVVLVLSLAACSNNLAGNNQQAGNGQNNDSYTEPPLKQPAEPFNPYGTWVWTGNDKFTLTLNEDGSAVLDDQNENSYINQYPRLQDLYFSKSNTFTYDKDNQMLTIHLKYEDRQAIMECNISIGNNYYMIDGGEFSYSFVRAENYQAAHQVFMDSPIYSRWVDTTQLKVGETVDLFPDNEVKLTLKSMEMDSEYNVKVHCTISCKVGVSSFDWIKWTLRVKGTAGERSDAMYFFDENGEEIYKLTDGQTVDCYFTIDSVDDEQSMAWFGELKAAVYISGMYIGSGGYIILPTQPT